MRRFQFPLQKLLDLRTQQVDLARRYLGLTMADLEEARKQLAEAHMAYGQALERTTVREAHGLNVTDFGSARAHLGLLKREIVAAERLVSDAEERVRAARKGLLDARQRERALEKLRERRVEQYQVEALREEQKELDEYGNRVPLNDGRLRTDNK